MKRRCQWVEVDGVPVKLQRTSKKPLTEQDRTALQELVRAVRRRMEEGQTLVDIRISPKRKRGGE